MPRIGEQGPLSLFPWELGELRVNERKRVESTRADSIRYSSHLCRQVCRSARSAETARMKTIIEEHNRKGRGAAGSGQSA